MPAADELSVSEYIAKTECLSRSAFYEVIKLAGVEPIKRRKPGSRASTSFLSADQQRQIDEVSAWIREGASMPMIRRRFMEQNDGNLSMVFDADLSERIQEVADANGMTPEDWIQESVKDKLPSMKTTPEWVYEPEAAKLLGLKDATLRLMRRQRKILPGQHWIFATGKPNGPVHYDITAIRKHLVELTIAAVQEEDQRVTAKRKECADLIETYDESNLDQLIAEVQS